MKVVTNKTVYHRLSYLRHYLEDELKQYDDPSGMYFWVYWPKFDEKQVSPSELIKLLSNFTSKRLAYAEEFSGKYKFKGEIFEQWFRQNGRLFGLSEAKHKKLIQFLQSRSSIEEFSLLFQELCFARPFYIGKANNLKVRLKQHFERRNSNIVDEIEKVRIPEYDIWVGYRIIEDKTKSGLNVIFEEVYSRTFKPGLTIKPN